MRKPTSILFSNTGALLAIQIANYALPFLLIPYLTRTLGVSLYGVVAFGLAIVQIACIITDYGFGLSATYKIAKQQNNKTELQKTISAVMTCKILLLAPAGVLLATFILAQDKYNQYHTFFWLLSIPIVGQTLQPIWFFQGIEKMACITAYTVVSRILYIALVIWLVSTPDDHYLVAVANGVASIIAATIGIGMMLRLGYSPKWCGWYFVKETFRESTEFFWSRAAVATYTAGGAVFLGVFSSSTQVAYYSAAEQLYKGAQALFSPLSQALYPHMAKHRNFSLLLKILKAVVAASGVALIAGVFVGPWLISLVFGPGFTNSYSILLLFMATFLFSAPSILLGYPLLGALGDSKSANISVIYAGLLQLLLLLTCYLLDFHLGWHIALTVLATEIFVLIYRSKASIKLIKGHPNNPLLKIKKNV
ncbi:oligosaccharide flippase family protein [Pseudomonas sp. UW4]|uniref:oligosaccharide flippase family protein n=1 Tax=Pseudomonas sp. UW4 TaxID=1207075 RepID=UPI00029D0F0F|nr:oligosaccharide flippase family protein [Pseudomonas sp. UW4]AFY20734.1 polysaccharide biosynthesis protein [Pseudomonas sp. UW4]